MFYKANFTTPELLKQIVEEWKKKFMEVWLFYRNSTASFPASPVFFELSFEKNLSKNFFSSFLKNVTTSVGIYGEFANFQWSKTKNPRSSIFGQLASNR